MRFLVLLAALAASTAFPASALAENQGDLDRCRFAGEFAKANESMRPPHQ
jgi:hypothetical protein